MSDLAAIAHNAELNAEDVIRLVQNNKVDLEASEIRELFRKHGTDEFYQKVRRACELEK